MSFVSRFLLLSALALLTTVACASLVHAQQPERAFLIGVCPSADSAVGPDMSVVEYWPTTPPKLVPSSLPRFPGELRRDGYVGQVVVAFLVDTVGVPMRASGAIMESTDPALSRWACGVFETIRFHPARLDGHAVIAQAMQSLSYIAFMKGTR